MLRRRAKKQCSGDAAEGSPILSSTRKKAVESNNFVDEVEINSVCQHFNKASSIEVDLSALEVSGTLTDGLLPAYIMKHQQSRNYQRYV